jgi:hypothetical protein
MPTPLILVTNDDGVHAPGSRWRRALPLGTVYVVAPDREVSACAQSLTLSTHCSKRVDERVRRGRNPADCVNLALVKCCRAMDLVPASPRREHGEDVFGDGRRRVKLFGVSIAFSQPCGRRGPGLRSRRRLRREAGRARPEQDCRSGRSQHERAAGRPAVAVTVRAVASTKDDSRASTAGHAYWIEEGKDRWRRTRTPAPGCTRSHTAWPSTSSDAGRSSGWSRGPVRRGARRSCGARRRRGASTCPRSPWTRRARAGKRPLLAILRRA